jgi:UDPglucose 6-dehydrogenase
MRVTVIGVGHVGLITAVGLASLGHDIVGTDSDEEKIDLLLGGGSPFFEPGLDDLLTAGVKAGRLRFTPRAHEALADADVVFICVGTPPTAAGDANLLAVERSAVEVARHAPADAVVVEKSTVPTGTAGRLGAVLVGERPGSTFEVVANPEFLREGRAVNDFLQPERILVGAESPRGFRTMRQLYRRLIERGCLLVETDIQTAELAKYACNAFLALKISFINGVARLCERSDADVQGVADVMGSDVRVGRLFLDAGLGYGGSCFPKDLVAFERLANRLGYDFPLLREIERINQEALESAFAKVTEALWHLEGKRVGLLGLAFKPGTDDVRFSPALTLARRLLDDGATVVAYDPLASANAKAAIADLVIASDPYDAASEADCLVVCTASEEFWNLDLAKLKDSMAHPFVVDGRNLFDPWVMGEAGFSYYSMGRRSQLPKGSRSVR